MGCLCGLMPFPPDPSQLESRGGFWTPSLCQQDHETDQVDEAHGSSPLLSLGSVDVNRSGPYRCCLKHQDGKGISQHMTEVCPFRSQALSWRRVTLPEVDNAFWLNYKTNSTMVEIPAELPKNEVSGPCRYWFSVRG